MNAATSEETARETGPYWIGLWARVRDWLATWTAVFPPQEILRDGLTRRLALRCCNWLWPLEATVRRLIIAAALAFDADALVPSARAPREAPDRPPSAAPRPASFRIVSIRGADAPRGAAYATGRAPPAERHRPFPADDLLRLGSAAPGQGRKPGRRGLNPLQRRGRPSDPDYTDYTPRSESDYANSSELLFGSAKDRESPAAHTARSDVRNPVPTQPEDSEWRRIEKERERTLPAPGIAARITALARVLDAPERQIRRLAHRLAADPGLAALLRGAPPPLLRKSKHDRFAPQVDEDLAILAHAEIRPPDTS